MRKIILDPEKIQYLAKNNEEGSTIKLSWRGVERKYLGGGYEIADISEIDEGAVYWMHDHTNEEIMGYVVRAGESFYFFTPSYEDENIEKYESRIWELLQNGLDYPTILDFLCL